MRKKTLLKTMFLLCALVVGSGSVWASEATDSYTATSDDKPKATNGTETGTVTGTSSISWSYSVTQETKSGKTPYVAYSDANGWQLGSSNSPCTAFSISTTGISGTISKIEVEAGSYNASSKINVTVGGSAFGTQNQETGNSSVTKITFNGSATGEIIVSATASSRAFYFKSVTITYESGPAKDPHGMSWSESTKAVTYNVEGTYTDMPTLNNPNGLDVTYSSTNSDVAEINSITGVLTIKNVNGYSDITATTEGDATHNSGSVSYRLTVTKLAIAPNDGETETLDFSQQGFTNQQSITNVEGENYTVMFDEGEGSNAPKYYTNGTAIRAYAKNTFTVSSDYKFRRVVLTFGSDDGSNTITTDGGTYEDGTWRGSANSVTFTIGGTNGNRRIAAVKVYFGEGFASKTVTSAGWATYIPDHNVDFAEGDAYIVTAANVEAGTVTVAEVESVPANTPVLLKGAGPKTITINDVALTAPATNLLTVCDGTAPTNGYYWALVDNEGTAQFMQWNGSGYSALNGLVVMDLDKDASQAPSASRALRFIFDEATGVKELKNSRIEELKSIYNLNGQRISQPTKGLYIKDGKKVFMK